MPKHRQAGFAVVREIAVEYTDVHTTWAFHGIIGVYLSTQRAEEVASAAIQKYLDRGMDPEFPEFRCKINPTNWYDE
jgi:hypothetical protein